MIPPVFVEHRAFDHAHRGTNGIGRRRRTTTWTSSAPSMHACIRELAPACRTSTIPSTSCLHSGEYFRQSIVNENAESAGTAYLIVEGCRRCKRKTLLDSIVS